MRLFSGVLRAISGVLSAVLFLNSVAVAATKPPLDAVAAKQAVQARGVGKGVRVQEADGTVARGKIVSIGEESFGVQTGSKPAVEIAFAKVTEVQGAGLSKGEKIGIVVAVGVVVAVVLVAVLRTRTKTVVYTGPPVS